MKTHATITTLNQRCGLYLGAMAAAFLFLLAMAGIAQAQTPITNVIYQDTFARSGLLNGSTPDTADATGSNYIAGPLLFTGQFTDQQGGTENACYMSNSISAALGPLYQEAFLPTLIETGHVYSLSASILMQTNYTVWWSALAYCSTPSLAAFQGQWTAGMLFRSTNNPGTGNGNFQVFNGSGTGGGTTFNVSPTSVYQPRFITFTEILNLTNPAAILEIWETNGVPIKTNNVGANLSSVGANNGMWPHFVTFGASNCGGWVTNFSLVDVVPFPAGPTIVEQPNNMTAAQGQTATFWVNAVATPDPTYQWMSNNVPILGATNATYTTPPLSMANNGSYYSVQVSNPVNPVTSSSALLTVTSGNPTVYSATKTASSTTIVVNFSGAVDPTTSQNAANYTLDINNTSSGISISSVSAGSTPSSVVLTTSSALDPNAAYYLIVNHVQDTFSDAMTGASTNVVLPAGLVLDLKGDSGVMVDTNGNVVQWLDQTTNANNAVDFVGWKLSTCGLALPGSTTRPSPTSVVNGLHTMTFNSANYTTLQVPSSSSTALNTNLTVYCVAQITDLNVNRHLLSKNIGNIPASFELDAVYSSGALSPSGLLGPDLINGAGGVNNVSEITGGGGVLAAPHVYAFTRQDITSYTNAWNGLSYPSEQTNWFWTASNTVSMFMDGAQLATNVPVNEAAPGFLDGQQPLCIGTREDHYANDIMNGQIMEILIFNTPLSGADRTNVDNYLGQKWFSGVTFLNPTPTITTTNGFAVSISPVPSSGSTHLSGFTWQVNGVTIPGANGSSYTTGILGPSDNGEIYSLIVSLANGSTFTNSTTVTVLTQPPYVMLAGLPIWNTNQVDVLFDEAVNPASAAVAGNYSLNNGATVTSAVMGLESNKVVLTTVGLTWNANPGAYTLTVNNVQDLYGNTLVSASPAVSLYPATALWLEGNNGIVTDSSAPNWPAYVAVQQWNDQSGNGDDMYSYTPASAIEPFFTTNYHGNMAVQFSGTNCGVNYSGKPSGTFLYSASQNGNDYPPLEITGDMTVFSVVTFNTLAGNTNGEIIGKTGSGVGKANVPASYDYNVSSTPNNSLVRGDGTNSTTITSTKGPSVGVPHIIAAMQQGATVTHFLDGALVGSGVEPPNRQEPYFDQGMPLCIGQRNDLANRLNGQMFELIIISSALDTNDLVSLNNYLAAKYTVPTGTNVYPAITAQPTTITNVYQYTTLTVPVGVTGNPLAMQWYSTNGTAITGQTNATLVIPNVQATNSYYLVLNSIYLSTSITSSVVVANVIPINPNPTNIVAALTNSNWTLSWPADHIGWLLQAQTNTVKVGISTNWFTVTGSGSTNKVVIPINLVNGTVFYRLMFP